MPADALPLDRVPSDASEALALGWPIPDGESEGTESDQNLWGV